ncbi:hypothetical protein SCUCBS95973_004476 [Sporothrix curviconia]|uniref:HNH nuclease domain-containing protein n=1 Tax=Sporothrix curviconia TaxID=1260050 RepID=A0ABP0BNY8_9PEZI
MRRLLAMHCGDVIRKQSTESNSHDTDDIRRCIVTVEKVFNIAALTVVLDATATLWRIPLIARQEPNDTDVESRLHRSLIHVNNFTGYILEFFDDGLHKNTALTRTEKQVPSWYGSRCILSGSDNPLPACIVPDLSCPLLDLVRAWNAVEMFWNPPSDDWYAAGTAFASRFRHCKAPNILPLSPDLQKLWDDCAFAIRPIRHPHAQSNDKMYIQAVFPTRQCSRQAPEDVSKLESLGIRHGNVYQLSTDDAASFPLPSFDLLRMRYVFHKLVEGVRDLDSLRVLFAGPPPEYVGLFRDGPEIPLECNLAIDAAMVVGILDFTSADKWRDALAVQYHHLQAARYRSPDSASDESDDGFEYDENGVVF